MATKQIAQGLASLGRNGDSVLVHMQPHEVAGLQAIAKAQGTELTTNPETGMPEAFSLGGFFSSLLPTVAGFVAPGLFPASPMMAGILAGAATGALTNKKDPLMGALTGGMGGFGGANLAKSALGMSGDTFAGFANKAGVEPTIAAINTPGAPSAMTVADQIRAPMTGQAAFQPKVTTYQANPIDWSKTGAMQSVPTPQAAGTSTFYGDSGSLLDDMATQAAAPSRTALETMTGNIANDPTAFLKSNQKNLALTLGGAALGGLEPTDIYGKPLKPSNADRYDPYATLNLAGDTGLRLYAAGGPVSFADGGDAMKGGGAGAMEGAGLMAVDVSDINAKYGYNPNESGSGLAGLAATPRVPVPTVGAFADADIINNARDSYERQLLQSMMANNRFGAMIPNRNQSTVANQLNQARTGQDGQGGMMTIAPLNIAPTAATAATAPTANTAATANTYNPNAAYAEGGTITTGGIRDLYGTADDQANGAVLSQNGYGLGRLNAMYGGGTPGMKKGGYLDGPGDGMSDSIPATIEGKQPARLADGEFVVPADVVSHLGNGSSKAGAKVLYSMLDKVRTARTGDKKQGKQINPSKLLPA